MCAGFLSLAFPRFFVSEGSETKLIFLLSKLSTLTEKSIMLMRNVLDVYQHMIEDHVLTATSLDIRECHAGSYKADLPVGRTKMEKACR